ncbi:DNA repair protein XRCC2 [Amphiprion ocellaris]|uniref:RecA family profile 1 domain-containing protein n=1 Tax=Amphiprion ocellaris TaxID=80972 RepID=A0A3Q1CE69_AMPOC|nr:DNA repair protein XRCC2 [Amphiprion ocellaris]
MSLRTVPNITVLRHFAAFTMKRRGQEVSSSSRRRRGRKEDEARAEMSESGAQLFARLEGRCCLKDIEPHLFPEDGGPDHGEVVELCGTEGTGKTELLYHLLCRCVLPEAAGGLEVDVVFVDTDYSLDMLRLVSILDSRLNTALSSNSSARSEEAALRSCLSRLLVVHCSSSSQLLLTLHFLETSLSSRPSLALLLIDSISAFYWLDRCGGGASFAKQEEKLSKCAELLERLLRDYRVTVFASCHAIRRSSSGPSSSSDSYLCRPWQRLVSHRLLCSRQDPVDSVAAAVGDRGQRMQPVFTVRCTSSSCSMKSFRSSSFCVTDGGVEFIGTSSSQDSEQSR